MDFKVTAANGSFRETFNDGSNQLISDEPITLTLEALGIERLKDNRFVCVQVTETDSPSMAPVEAGDAQQVSTATVETAEPKRRRRTRK